MNALVSEVLFEDARGGRKASSPLSLSVARPLGEEDIQRLGEAQVTPAQRLLKVKQAHHNLAQLIARGIPQVEISLITGYSPAYISSIQNDPAFAELVAYYSIQREMIHSTVVGQMGALGQAAVSELQARIDEAPEKFANRELMELVETTIVKPAQVKGSGGGSGSPGNAVNIEVKFVGANRPDIVDITPGQGR